MRRLARAPRRRRGRAAARGQLLAARARPARRCRRPSWPTAATPSCSASTGSSCARRRRGPSCSAAWSARCRRATRCSARSATRCACWPGAFALRGLASLDFLLDGERVSRCSSSTRGRRPAWRCTRASVDAACCSAHLRACQHGVLPPAPRRADRAARHRDRLRAARAAARRRRRGALIADWPAPRPARCAAPTFAAGDPLCSCRRAAPMPRRCRPRWRGAATRCCNRWRLAVDELNDACAAGRLPLEREPPRRAVGRAPAARRPTRCACACERDDTGVRIVDAGIAAPGSVAAGLLIGEICMGGLRHASALRSVARRRLADLARGAQLAAGAGLPGQPVRRLEPGGEQGGDRRQEVLRARLGPGARARGQGAAVRGARLPRPAATRACWCWRWTARRRRWCCTRCCATAASRPRR